MEVDDLSQEGLLLLVNVWQRSSLTSREKEELFLRDLLNHLRNRARESIRHSDPTIASIDLDALLDKADCSVLASVYARAFKRETLRLFSGIDRTILEHMIGEQQVRIDQVKGRYVHASGQWLQSLSERLGLTRGYLSQKISLIRRRIRETLAA